MKTIEEKDIFEEVLNCCTCPNQECVTFDEVCENCMRVIRNWSNAGNNNND